jgi:hypothetical protein
VAVQTPKSVLTTELDGQTATGFSLSWTVTVKVQVAVLETASVAVPVTVVVPLLKVAPLGGTDEVVTPAQLSLAVKEKDCTAVQRPGAVLILKLEGQEIVGF